MLRHLLDPEQKHRIYTEYHLNKPCKVCKHDNSDQFQFIFCQNCDDGYHWKCLDPPLTEEIINQLKDWTCPDCVQHQNESRPTIKVKEKECYRCKKGFQQETHKYIEALCIHDQNKSQKVKIKIRHLNAKICRFCQHSYHPIKCFNRRNNCLNCWECEAKIRKQCPKSHCQFISNYIYKSQEKIKQFKLIELRPLISKPTANRSPKLHLKLFLNSSDWQTICRCQSSLYYALRTINAYYFSGQLYHSIESMQLNKSSLNITPPAELHQSDQAVYEQFLKITSLKFRQFPSLQIKQDYQKGFYVVAAEFIAAKTLLCQYGGEVCSRKQGNKKHSDNDSVMSLIVTHFAQTSLDIAPVKFSNFSRFIAGIPPHKRNLINIQTINFSYRGRSHIIFYSLRDIQKSETLYIDYNSGLFEEYPTEQFVS